MMIRLTLLALLLSGEFQDREDFSEQEKTALRLAERVTHDAHSVDDQLWRQLRQHFDEGEIVELLAAIGLFNYFNRFNDALRMEPTK
jgi:alkylhydroperoxidase family enzyme